MPTAIPIVVFAPGKIQETRGVKDAIPARDKIDALQRHMAGDWGDMHDEDRAANDAALQNGERILSCYRTENGIKFWIITESDRSRTTVLLPEEY